MDNSWTAEEKKTIIRTARDHMKRLTFGYITKDGKVSQDREIEVVELDERDPYNVKVWGRDMKDKRKLKRFDLDGMQEIQI